MSSENHVGALLFLCRLKGKNTFNKYDSKRGKNADVRKYYILSNCFFPFSSIIVCSFRSCICMESAYLVFGIVDLPHLTLSCRRSREEIPSLFLMKCFMQYSAGFFKQNHILPLEERGVPSLWHPYLSLHQQIQHTLRPTCSARWLWN